MNLSLSAIRGICPQRVSASADLLSVGEDYQIFPDKERAVITGRDNELSVEGLASLLGVGPRAIQRKIKRGRFPTAKKVQGRGRGGKVLRIDISDRDIPSHVKKKFFDKSNRDAAMTPLPDPDKPQPSEASSAISALQGELLKRLPLLSASENGKVKALARADLSRRYDEYLERSKKAGISKGQASYEFLENYNNGILYSYIFSILGRIKKRTVENWIKIYREFGNDWQSLLRKRSSANEDSGLSGEEKTTFMKFLLHPNKIKIGTAFRLTKHYLEGKGIVCTHSPMTFRRYAGRFQKDHYDRWVLMREGQKALRDKVEPYITRDPSLLNVGDVLVADGHRLNFKVKNPFTGKPCRATLVGYVDWKSYDLCGYEIMVEESTQCIASALRNSILHLNRIPQIIYCDNGKAFRAKFFSSTESFEEAGLYGLFARLGIVPVFARPYNARAKIIERWFKEFSDTFERLLPSFTGASIEDKPAWMLRNEKFHKALHKEHIPTVEETIELINAWLQFHRSQPCPHMNGKTIGEVFEQRAQSEEQKINISDLDDLMLASKKTKIGRNGIRLFNADYYDDNLYGFRGEIIVKYSLFDITKIKIFTLQGEFLCTAMRRMDVHPMARYLGDVKDIEELKMKTSQQRSLERKTIEACKLAKKLGSLQAGKSASLLPWQKVAEISPRVIERLEREDVELPATDKHIPEECVRCDEQKIKSEEPIAESREQRAESGVQSKIAQPQPQTRPFFYEWWERFEWHLKFGVFTEEDRVWIEWYKSTSEYRMIYESFENQKTEDQLICHDRAKASGL